MVNNQYTNIPEDGREIIHTIYDKLGDAYTIEGDLSPTGFLSLVCSETGCIGRINWDTAQPGIMVIADLIIFEPRKSKPWWARIFPFLHKQPPDYRGRGLGSAMLNFIITSARAMGITEIRGWIRSDDLAETPYLPAFYRKHGFTVNDSELTFYQVMD